MQPIRFINTTSTVYKYLTLLSDLNIQHFKNSYWRQNHIFRSYTIHSSNTHTHTFTPKETYTQVCEKYQNRNKTATESKSFMKGIFTNSLNILLLPNATIYIFFQAIPKEAPTNLIFFKLINKDLTVIIKYNAHYLIGKQYILTQTK